MDRPHYIANTLNKCTIPSFYVVQVIERCWLGVNQYRTSVGLPEEFNWEYKPYSGHLYRVVAYRILEV